MNRLEKIENLLNDDLELEKYINSLENTNFVIPKDLNKNIKNTIKIKKKIHYLDICKIAACLIFALLICRTDSIKNDILSNYKYEKKYELKDSDFKQKLSDLCSFLKTPLNLEKEEI